MANPNNKRIRSEEVLDIHFPVLCTRMTPSGIVNFINSDPSEKQITDIKEMGFDGLLSLKTDKIPGDLSYWLVSNFDPFSSSLMDGDLPIKDEDIHRATGIPMGPLKIVEATKPDYDEDFNNLVKSWASQFGTRQVDKKHVLEKMKEQKEGGEDFKRNFIVYIVSTLLMGVKGATVSCRILKSLQDVSLISKFNWCYYTRQHFINSVLEWKRESCNGYTPLYRGPVLIIVFIYLDRVSFKGERRFNNVYPTLSAWTKEDIKKRIKEERMEAKRFGLGAVEEPLARACLHESTSENHNKHDACEEEKCQVPTCIEVLAEAAKEFAQAYAKFSKAVQNAKCEAPNAKAVCQMAALAEAMVEGFNTTQHKKEETIGREEDIEDKMEEDDKGDLEEVKLDKGKEKIESEGTNEGFDVVAAAIANDDKFLSDPVVIRMLNEAMDQLDMAFRPQASKVRKHRQAKDPDVPSFSLFDSQDSLYVTPGYEDDPPKIHGNTSHTVPPHITSPVSSPTARRSPRLSPTTIPRSPPKVHGNTSQNVPPHITSPVSSPTARRSPRLSPKTIPCGTSLQPAEETKNLNKRNREISSIYKSPFIERNINLLVDLKQAEKEVADFSFADEFDDRYVPSVYVHLLGMTYLVYLYAIVNVSVCHS